MNEDKDSCLTANEIRIFLIKGAMLGLCLLICLGAGFISAQNKPGLWYYHLQKPVWTPPNYVFAPVWTALFILMGYALWMVWVVSNNNRAVPAYILFFVQLSLNVLWSYFFFGLQDPRLAFFDIILLWISIVLTIIYFWRVRPGAGIVLIPYLVWVTFAGFLNYSIWYINS